MARPRWQPLSEVLLANPSQCLPSRAAQLPSARKWWWGLASLSHTSSECVPKSLSCTVFTRADRKDYRGPQRSHVWNIDLTCCRGLKCRFTRGMLRHSLLPCRGAWYLVDHSCGNANVFGKQLPSRGYGVMWSGSSRDGAEYCAGKGSISWPKVLPLISLAESQKALIQHLLIQYFISLLLLQIQRKLNHQRMHHLHRILDTPV